jgi:hypothetical protein
MKKINPFYALSLFLLVAGILLSGCKKEEDPIVPSFTVTAINVQLQGGAEGLQFFGKCTNDDVKMTKVTINDPLGVQNTTYNINGNYFVKNEAFGLQDATVGYTKELGTWSFTFVGNRTADGVSFSVSTTLSVTGK